MSRKEAQLSMRMPPKDSGRKVVPEFPMGEALVQRTIDSVNMALRENTPPEFHPKLNLNPTQINFSKTKDQILAMEIQARSAKPQYMHDGLIESGMPANLINRLFSSIEAFYPVPVYCHQPDIKTPVAYVVPRGAKHNLSKSEQVRLQTAIFLGYQLIEHTVTRLTIPKELPRIPWEAIIRDSMEESFKWIAEASQKPDTDYPNLNIGKFNSFRRKMNDLLSARDVKFVAHGAEVHVIFPGQDLATSDFNLGPFFNQGIVTLISKPIERRFVSLLLNKRSNSYQERPELESRAFDIITTLSANTRLSKEDIFGAFAHSKIPTYCLEYLKREKPLDEVLVDRIFKSLFGINSSVLQEESAIDLSTYPH